MNRDVVYTHTLCLALTICLSFLIKYVSMSTLSADIADKWTLLWQCPFVFVHVIFWQHTKDSRARSAERLRPKDTNASTTGPAMLLTRKGPRNTTGMFRTRRPSRMSSPSQEQENHRAFISRSARKRRINFYTTAFQDGNKKLGMHRIFGKFGQNTFITETRQKQKFVMTQTKSAASTHLSG